MTFQGSSTSLIIITIHLVSPYITSDETNPKVGKYLP